jgi:hypothetical protein
MWRERKKPISSQLAKFSMREMSTPSEGAASLAATRSATVVEGEYGEKGFSVSSGSASGASASRSRPGEEGRVRAGSV